VTVGSRSLDLWQKIGCKRHLLDLLDQATDALAERELQLSGAEGPDGFVLRAPRAVSIAVELHKDDM
jgi:hypothetical protein